MTGRVLLPLTVLAVAGIALAGLALAGLGDRDPTAETTNRLRLDLAFDSTDYRQNGTWTLGFNWTGPPPPIIFGCGLGPQT